MLERIRVGTLDIHASLYHFITNEVLPQTGVSVEQFWNGFEKTLQTLSPQNKLLLKKRSLLFFMDIYLSYILNTIKNKKRRKYAT